jgi:photosystem II stability/assembly factor-like uncharacterized protein
MTLGSVGCGGDREGDDFGDPVLTSFGEAGGMTGDDAASDDESSGGDSDGTTSGGDDSGGTTSGGDDSGGTTSGGTTSGGSTSGGSTSGGTTSGGTTSGGTTGSTSGGTSAGSGGDGNPNGDGWETIDVGTDEDLVAVDFADGQNGWVVGTGEVLLHTTDGGDNWDSQEDGFWTGTTDTEQLQAHTLNPYPAWGVYHLLDVHALSPDIAWVSSIGPLKQPVSLNPDYLTAVFVTDDGGTNWQRLTLATNFQVWGIHGFDAETARAATIGSSNHPDSDIYMIYDGANQANVKMSWGGLRDITFVDDQVGYTAGAGVEKSVNGGSSWNDTNPPGGFYWAVDFINQDQGWVVGENGKIIFTNDGGDNWQDQDSGTNTDLYGVSFVNQNDGFVAGDDGIVLITADGGANWVEEDSGTGQWINDIEALSADEAWATADGGVLLHRVP